MEGRKIKLLSKLAKARMEIRELKDTVKKLKSFRYLRGWNKTGVTWASYEAKCDELSKAQEEIAEIKSILLEVGAETHKNKRLHEWYCENK